MGLIGGIARTAVIAGTATAVSNRVSRRQAGRWAAQDQQEYEAAAYREQAYQGQPAQETAYAPPPPAAAPAGGSDMDTKLAHLKQLADLKAQGILSEAEFEAQKARILSS